MRAALAASLLFACASPSPTPPAHTDPPATPPPTKSDPAATPPVDPPPVETSNGGGAKPTTAPGIGEKCGPNDACAPPATCVSYYGIAGPRIPAFKSCEVKCSDGATCPDGRSCTSIKDGPGAVCR